MKHTEDYEWMNKVSAQSLQKYAKIYPTLFVNILQEKLDCLDLNLRIQQTSIPGISKTIVFIYICSDRETRESKVPNQSMSTVGEGE